MADLAAKGVEEAPARTDNIKATKEIAHIAAMDQVMMVRARMATSTTISTTIALDLVITNSILGTRLDKHLPKSRPRRLLHPTLL
jgi:hypothetical protein